MITMGGIPENYPFLDQLLKSEDITFLIPGAGQKAIRRRNLILLPHRSEFFHPDLVTASDALVGKVGYSTLSEVYWAGIPFGYIARDDFRESPALISFIEKNMRGLPLSAKDFASGAFASHLRELFALGSVERNGLNGAEQAARFLLNLVKNTGS